MHRLEQQIAKSIFCFLKRLPIGLNCSEFYEDNSEFEKKLLVDLDNVQGIIDDPSTDIESSSDEEFESDVTDYETDHEEFNDMKCDSDRSCESNSNTSSDESADESSESTLTDSSGG